METPASVLNGKKIAGKYTKNGKSSNSSVLRRLLDNKDVIVDPGSKVEVKVTPPEDG